MAFRTLREVIEGQVPISGTVDMTVREAAQRMVDFRVGALLIMESGQLTGIFTERDALARVMVEGRNPDTTTVVQVMTRNPLCIMVDQSLCHALQLMQDHGVRHLPVLDGTVPVGMVSARDALAVEWIDLEKQREQQEEIACLLR